MVFLSGCTRQWGGAFYISQKEQNAILDHLENKYGEKFAIGRIVSDRFLARRGVYVHPIGKEDESFFVGEPSDGTFVDDYFLPLPDKRMQPLYEEWIQSIIPSAKVAVKLGMYPGGKKEVIYDPDETLQQFVAGADELHIEVNIILSEDMLEHKDEIFEKISEFPEIEPISGFQDTRYTIGFFEQQAFDSEKSGEYRYMSLYVISEDDPDNDLVALTYCYTEDWKKKRPTSNVWEQLNENFKIREAIE